MFSYWIQWHLKISDNISTHLDVEAAMKFGAKGVGLFRSEFLFMGRDTIPDEETQFKANKRRCCLCSGT